MLPFLANAFNDPSDPWYYVVGVIFLLLIFGAVGVYMYLVGRKNKSSSDKADNTAEADVADKEEVKTDKAEVNADEQATESADKVAQPKEQDKE
ncbi:MAG: hypothetical protein K2L88_03285 [Clostridiales bacterium]|nr:hypothetical protein [Clostridiales bacterium]